MVTPVLTERHAFFHYRPMLLTEFILAVESKSWSLNKAKDSLFFRLHHGILLLEYLNKDSNRVFRGCPYKQSCTVAMITYGHGTVKHLEIITPSNWKYLLNWHKMWLSIWSDANRHIYPLHIYTQCLLTWQKKVCIPTHKQKIKTKTMGTLFGQ